MGLSIWQILIIVAIALLFFGPKRIPGLGKSLGEAIRGFKKGLEDDEIEVSAESKKIEADSSESATQTQKEKHKEEV